MADSKVIKLSELINPTARQKQFLDTIAKHPYTLYGGAAGGGKSYMLRWFGVITAIKAYAVYGVPNTKFGLFCEDFPALRNRHLSVWDVPRELGTIGGNQQEGLRFKLIPQLGGGMVMLHNLDDPNKYDSAEFIGAAVDEWTKNPWAVFDELRKRLRWKTRAEEPHLPCGGRVANREGIKIDCPIKEHHIWPAWNYPFAKGSNPGGIGHGETKRVYIDQDFPQELIPIKHLFAFVPAKSTDNPYNPADYYEKNLATLPENMRRAYAEGDWDLFVGQFFSEWRKELHVCKAFPIPGYWKKWRAGDWGWNTNTSIGWYTKSPDNLIYKYRELYVRQLTPAQVAKRIHELETGEKIDYGMLDPSCWNSHDGGLSVAEQFQNEGISWLKAENDRSGGWTRVRELLRWERNPAGELIRAPQFQVFENCTNTIRTFPSQVFDENKPEDLDTDGEDHAVDETRYGLNSRHGSTIVPIEQLPDDLAEAMLRLQHQSG